MADAHDKHGRPVANELLLGLGIGLVALVLPIIASTIASSFFAQSRWYREETHSAVAAVSAVLAIILAILLVLGDSKGRDVKNTLCACGFGAMGVLGLCHACMQPDNTFVWLDSLDGFVGGIIFGSLWLPISTSSDKARRGLPVVVTCMAGVLGLVGIFLPGWLPRMFETGTFTRTADLLNYVAGTGFLLGSLYFRKHYYAQPTRRPDDILFGGFCLIYAVAHYTFPFSAIWDASWWFWHFLRLAACMLAFGYVLLAFLRSRRQIEQSNLALERRAEELSQSQIALERTNSALSREIEERRRAEAQLLELAADLKRSNLDLEDFAHVVSHDLKAPLRALSMIAKLTAEDYSDILDQAGKENLTRLVGQTERMGGLIDGVLRYSQVGYATSDPRIVDVGQLVNDVTAALNPPQHIAVRVEGTFPQVRYDATQLEQVFQNLISNAIKYQDKPQGEVVIACRDESAHWAFCVRDTGMGIHERNWDQIFQLFHILHQRDERDASGVGLAVVKRIVERHRGVISVESVVGEGSCFTFTVPKSLPNGSKHP